MKFTGEPLNILHTIGLKELYPIIRISFSIDKNLDITRFKKAIILCNKVVPELFCKYVLRDNSFVPVTSDLTNVLFIDIDPDQDSEKWNLFSDPQLRVYLNKTEDGYGITIYLSHILTDGAGGKQFLYLLAKAYNNGRLNETNHQDIAWVRQLIKDHPQNTDTKVVHPTNPLSLPTLAESGNDRRRTVTYRLSAVETSELQRAAHHRGVTLNDLFMASFGQAVQRYSSTDKISLACPTDMRKFNPTPNQLRIANHTSRYNISVNSNVNAPFQQLVMAVHKAMEENKQNFQCLQSIQELIGRYDNYSLSALQEIVEDNYHVRNISYTNFGIVDNQKFFFEGCNVKNFDMLGTYRKYPMFQVAISTYDQQINLSFAMVGNEEEERMGRAVVLTMMDLLRNYYLTKY